MIDTLPLDFTSRPEAQRSVFIPPVSEAISSLSYTLRDYQQLTSDKIFEAWQKYWCVLAVLATGLGKTIIATDVIRRMHPGRTMFLAHTEELIFQAHSKIRTATGLGCEIEMADLRAATSLFCREDVIVSTIQTQIAGKTSKRMDRFNPNDFALLIIDECHRAPAASYKQVIAHYRKNPNLKVLGITATPKRTDALAMGQIFDATAINLGIEWAVNNGWLVPIVQQLKKVKDLDWSGIHTTAGDLNGAELSKVMEEEEIVQCVAGAAMETVGDHRTLAFTASVLQAELLCKVLNRHKAGSADWVSGKTPKEERRDKVKRFTMGDLQFLCNCQCFTHGFDVPETQYILMAKPTKSIALYEQMLGRGTRPLPGIVDGPPTAVERRVAIEQSAKPVCTVIDLSGNCGKHKIITATDVLGGVYSDEVKARAKKKLEKAEKGLNVQGALIESERELQKEKEARERREEQRRAHIKARVTFTTKHIDPFDRHDRDVFQSGISRDGKTFSAAQAGILAKNGINPATISYVQGQGIIGKIMSKPSEGQRNCLVRNGYSIKEVDAMSRKLASKTIDALSANNWRRPVESKITPADVPHDRPPADVEDDVPF